MLGDTICAVASPPGAAVRGVIRVSGPDALGAVGALLATTLPLERAAHETAVDVLGHAVECLVLVMPGPRSYTGEDVVELHLPGSPLLLEGVLARLRGRLRDATPGEFTRRAYENGRLDLAAAEAVHDLICAADDEQRRRALALVDGSLTRGVEQVRGLLQDARALLEAGLDFTDGETGEVAAADWLPGLAAARTQLAELAAELPAGAAAGELVLLGATNAGKSSLANALAPGAQLLVSAQAGTTRDVLAVEVAPGVTLLDGPGDLPGASGVDQAALALRDRVMSRGTASILVVDLTAPQVPARALPVAAVVLTKLDLAPQMAPARAKELPADLAGAPVFAVSSATGVGLAALREFLGQRSAGGPVAAGRRAADLLDRARWAIERAEAGAAAGAPEEVLAVELGDALAALDALHGKSSPEAVLDRIFAGFCLGK